MAKNLIQLLNSGNIRHLLVLAGNVHSAIEIGNPFDPNYRPMAYELHAQPNSPVKPSDIRALLLR
ncbi:MAG: hypothetical protein AB7F86_18180 [Bdellovibrionales bacterium]